MSSLCLTDGGLSAALFAQALHLAWTPADGVPREASWLIERDRIVVIAERMRESGAAQAPPGALAVGGWLHTWPARAPQPRIVLERAALRSDYVLCAEGVCVPLERLLPRARASRVTVAACPS